MSDVSIDTIVELSYLQVTPAQAADLGQQIDRIVDYMRVLDGITDSPEPEYEWPIDATAVTREDQPVHFESPLIEANAPAFTDGGFLVPRVL
jgi:aspartyl/glutamyl-tRNA(Asn/Gln) amidotransferase C subunit